MASQFQALSAGNDDPANSKTCMECGRVFTKAAHLLRHVRSHAQQKPFSCSVCGKAFARTDALQRHERTVHSAKRRRTETGLGSNEYAGSGIDEEQSEPSLGNSTPEPFAGVDMTFNGADFVPSEGMSVSPLATFAGMVTQPTTTSFASDDPTAVDMGANAYAPHFPPPMFLSGFPGTRAPSTVVDLDQLVAEWLNQDGGDLITENTLAMVFSDQGSVRNGSTEYTSGIFNGEPIPTPHSQSYTADQSRGFSSNPPSATLPLPLPGQTTAIPASVLEPAQPAAGGQSRRRGPHRKRRATVVSTDTWESGLLAPSAPTSPPDSPRPADQTADKVVEELHVNGIEASADSRHRESVIPSMQFLDACLHLYFREFHPTYPVIHRPTFRRECTSPLLLLSMCSIGCMFIGTQAARDSGLWIYERLHYVVVVTRDAKMRASEEMRLDVNLSALLGQCFSFLYGKPKHMLTAESFHGTLCTMARRNGLSKKIKANPVTYEQVANLDAVRLQRKWREWGQQETLRRVSLGLAIHAAELTVYSGMARLISAQVSREDGFSDALFEANDAETWRSLLCASENGQLGSHYGRPVELLSTTPETFFPMVLLAQSIVNVHKVRELLGLPHQSGLPHRTVTHYYEYMMPMALDFGVLPVAPQPSGADIPAYVRSLSALWHYACAVRLAPMDLIEEVAGRGGSPTDESIAEIEEWASTPGARLATIHAAYVLHYSADLRDVSFLIPRAIFQSSLLLLGYLSHVTFMSDERGVVDVLEVNEWARLAQICDGLGSPVGSTSSLHTPQPCPEDQLETQAQRYIAHGMHTIKLRGVLDGGEKMLDIVSLRSTSNRLLRRCTPWGIGETLGDILSSVSF